MTNISNSTGRICDKLPTGAVLLADIIPTLVIKYTAPFFMQRIPFGIRIFIIVLLNIGSYFVVAYSSSVPMSLAGVCFASAGSGLGEITFLSLAAYYTRIQYFQEVMHVSCHESSTISTWSSGTGAAGVLGAFAYAAIIQAGLSPKNTLLLQITVPISMAFHYWILLKKPPSLYQITLDDPTTWLVPKHHAGCYAQFTESDAEPPDKLTLTKKLKLILPLLKYMVPLGAVYCAEYFINQGLQQLIYFDGIDLSPTHFKSFSRKDQYRWYQVIYQVGVLISRSSVNIIKLPMPLFYALPVLQFANVAIFFTQALYFYMPSIWIVFVLILFEGLLGGAAYVNTFYRIKQDVRPEYVEYSLGVASIADSTGIVIAGFSSIPIHNWVCNQPLPANHKH